MNRHVRLLLAIWVPMLLIGHGGGLECCADLSCDDCFEACGEDTPSASVEYDVVGNCGPSGHVTVSKSENQCDVKITGDNVGIATSGSGSITDGWRTRDLVQMCTARRINDTRLQVTCNRLLGCTSFFIRSDQGCDVDACDVPLCLGEWTLGLGETACCPTCMFTPSDSGVPFDAGNPNRDASTDAMLDLDSGGEDLDSGNDEPTWCDAARAEYEDQYASYSATWGACAEDGDCTITDVDSDCSRHCNLALNEDIYEGDTCDASECMDLEELLNDSASTLCNGCVEPSPCPPRPDAEARCIDHLCTLVINP